MQDQRKGACLTEAFVRLGMLYGSRFLEGFCLIMRGMSEKIRENGSNNTWR